MTNLLEYINGRKIFQNLFKLLQNKSLEGQNYYNAVNVNFSGERKIVNYILSKSSKREFIFFDIGANTGQYFDLFKPQINTKIVAHLFEPQKEYTTILRQKYHNYTDVYINHCAVSDTDNSNSTLYICSQNRLIATLFPFPLDEFIPGLILDIKEEVTTIKLSDYCKDKNIVTIDLLKLDIEGLEYQCLEDMNSFIINRSIRYIQFEYCFLNMSQKNYFYDFWKLLQENYLIYRILVDGIEHIPSYSIIQEQMAPINYLAISKNEN